MYVVVEDVYEFIDWVGVYDVVVRGGILGVDFVVDGVFIDYVVVVVGGYVV